MLDDLRQLARGVYPSALRDFGLERALSSAAWRSSQPTKFSATAVGRYLRRRLEAAVYFCCLESIRTSHATPAPMQRPNPVVDGQRRPLLLAVEDDGVGFREEGRYAKAAASRTWTIGSRSSGEP